jgi:uncharacterized glyoxalase superfamily protein PhnB
MTTTRSLYPCFRYQDAHAAIEWLTDVLGFEVSASYPDDAGGIAHAELIRDGGMIMLGSARDDEMFDAAQPDGRSAAACYLAVEDAELDKIWDRVQAAGWTVLHPLRAVDHGGRELDVRDPGGVFWGVGSYRP